MISRRVKITFADGLQVQTAAALVSACRVFDSDVILRFNDNEYNLKSVLGVVAAGAGCGDEVEFVCIGPEEEAAMLALLDVVNKLKG